MNDPILAKNLLGILREAGVLPPKCQRVVLDLQLDDVAKVYFECIGDTRLIELSGEIAKTIQFAEQHKGNK